MTLTTTNLAAQPRLWEVRGKIDFVTSLPGTGYVQEWTFTCMVDIEGFISARMPHLREMPEYVGCI